MTLPDNRRLKSAASDSINNAACNPGLLVLFHTAVVLALSLLGLIIDFVLERQIGNTGGLDGVGLRSVLTTMQTVLHWVQIIALPFWLLGWRYATMKIARGETADKKDLLEGFRRFFPYLRLTILKGLIFIGLALCAAYVASFIVMLLPVGGSAMDSMNPNLTEAELIAQMEEITFPMMTISAVAALALMVPFYYRFRMAEYFLLDNPHLGARSALRGSRMLMKGNMWRMMGLDLSFWWFFLLSLVVSALAYADVLLPLWGVELPWSYEVSYFAAFLLAAAAQLVLYYFCKAKVDVTYAHVYETLITEEEIYESH